MNHLIETLEGNFSEREALQIRREEQQKGHRVNITRLYSRRVRIEILKTDKVIQARYSIKQLNQR